MLTKKLDLFKKYGKVTIKKRTLLYHWSKVGDIKKINKNSFFCSNVYDGSGFGNYLYTFKVKKDIGILFAISNEQINKNNKVYTPYTHVHAIKNGYRYMFKEDCFCEFNNIYIDIFEEEPNLKCKYDPYHDCAGLFIKNSDDDGDNENRKREFKKLCDGLSNHGVDGLFNFVDCQYFFEIIIFDTDTNLELIDVKQTKEIDITPAFDIFNPSEIIFDYPHDFIIKFDDNFTEKEYLEAYGNSCRASIFYYIYKQKLTQKN